MASDPDPDQLVRTQSTDAHQWAQAFVNTINRDPRLSHDVGTMIGWFANAMMAVHDSEANNRRQWLAAMDHDEANQVLMEEWEAACATQAIIDGPKPGEITVQFEHLSPEAIAILTGTGPKSREQKLADWWRSRAESEIDMVVAKAVEYGAGDLREIGRQLVQAGVTIGDRANRSVDPADTDAWYAELGVYFYLLGKVARWTSAIEEGRPVSADTLLDIGVYVRMAQRIREAGGWPAV